MRLSDVSMCRSIYLCKETLYNSCGLLPLTLPCMQKDLRTVRDLRLKKVPALLLILLCRIKQTYVFGKCILVAFVENFQFTIMSSASAHYDDDALPSAGPNQT